MAFSAEVFKSLFQTEEDWKGFYQMVYEDELRRLYEHENMIEGEKKGLKLIFRRISDHRYEAYGEANKAWSASDDARKYALQLEAADKSIKMYNDWLNRKYTDRKLIHTDWNPYGEFQKPEMTAGGNKKWVNADVEEIA